MLYIFEHNTQLLHSSFHWSGAINCSACAFTPRSVLLKISMAILCLTRTNSNFTRSPIECLDDIFKWKIWNYTRSSAVAETARRFMSLNISLSHSRSFENTPSVISRAKIPISIPLKLCQYLVPFLRYSASNNDVTLKSWLGVTRGH